jgi:endonuclease/exonuclease/phosphatase family metal-dependent hydrolase
MIPKWLKFLAVSAAAVLTAARAAEPETLRVMTYNIRLDLASDGPNAWAHRRAWVSAQVAWLRPDVFGLQEVLPAQKSDLLADLPGYRFVGEGRDANGAGEASPVAFDHARFELLESGTFWLSPTPRVSSRAWDAAHPRIVTWARLRDARSEVLAINTHWDHIGLIARRRAAAQLAEWIRANARRCDRVVLLGDFNSEMDSAQMRMLTRVSAPDRNTTLRDARAVSRSAPFGPAGTFNDFQLQPATRRVIDHILVGGQVEVERFAVISQVIDGRVPSDHFPVLADLRLRPCPHGG